MTLSTRTLAIVTTIVASTPMVATSQSPVSHTVFVHGAQGYGMYPWGTAISSLVGTYNFSQSYIQQDVPNATSMWVWYQYLDNDFKPDTSIMAGYSLGGVASRDLAQYENIAGLITVGSPHTGAPIAASIPSAEELVADINYDISFAIGVGTGEFLEAVSGLGESWYWAAIAAMDNSIYDMLNYFVNLGYGYLNGFPSGFQTDLPPGSSFMSQLPTGVSNSFTQSVRMSPGHGGGPLALFIDEEDADDTGEYLAAWGIDLTAAAYNAQNYIDWGHEHAYVLYDALFGLAVIGSDLVNFPVYWCRAVTSGDVGGSCSTNSDGLIPTSRQTFAGANNDLLDPGPAHTRELLDPDIIDYVGTSICTISPNC